MNAQIDQEKMNRGDKKGQKKSRVALHNPTFDPEYKVGFLSEVFLGVKAVAAAK